jgi:hypothetical protein
MKAAELRIGNWINTIEGSAQVREITDYERLAVGADKRVVDLQTAGPIPLTEEILLKAGFERYYNEYHHTNQFTRKDFKLILRSEKYEGYTPCSHGEYLYSKGERLKYLHQLQNLYYALTGQELEINL